MNDWLRSTPEWVNATKATIIHASIEDTGISSPGYPDSDISPINVSWSESHNKPEVVIVGANERITCNDSPFQENVHVYQKEIPTISNYPVPLHLQPAYACLGYSTDSHPVSDKCAAQVLSLPMEAELTT